MTNRYATHADLEALGAAAWGYTAVSKAPHVRYADELTVSLAIAKAIAEQRILISGDYAAMFDIGSDWFSNKPMLIEQLVWRFQKVVRNPVSNIIDELTSTALVRGCVAVVCGDTQGLGIMASHYTAAGFTCLGTQHMKEL
jgi:hypothetical protein